MSSSDLKAPAPEKASFPWPSYQVLKSSKFESGEDDPMACENNQFKVPTRIEKLAYEPLSQTDLDEWNFGDESLAALAYCRATALCDMLKPQGPSVLFSRALLLLARSALWLAAKSHFDNIDIKPQKTAKSEGGSVKQRIRQKLMEAGRHRSQRASCLADIARICILQVANDKGVHSRPGIAEAWLLRCEIQLLMSELTAALEADTASGERPKGRIGPWELVPDDEDNVTDDYDEHLGWEIDVPFYDIGGNCEKTYLADYWWGQAGSTARFILFKPLRDAQTSSFRFRSLVDAGTYSELAKRFMVVEHSFGRRAAAALANWDAVETNPKGRKVVEDMRYMFPGTPFEPTEEFVRGMDQYEDDDETPPQDKVWNMSCMLGAFGEKNATMVTVMDTGVKSPFSGMIMDSKMCRGEDPNIHHMPSAKDLYRLLLAAMAGAGSETRAYVGPPRRPSVLVLSYRLRDRHAELSELLERVEVPCILNSEEELRFACANMQTDFETGGERKKEEADTLVGQRVRLNGLKARSDLNGRVGRVTKWVGDVQRWRVKLECFLDGEEPLVIGVKPENLTSCPQEFIGPNDYVRIREEAFAVRAQEEEDLTRASASTLQKLQGISVPGNSICVICQEQLEAATEKRSMTKSGTCLPCGHTFHLQCLLPWAHRKPECPCCRQSFE